MADGDAIARSLEAAGATLPDWLVPVDARRRIGAARAHPSLVLRGTATRSLPQPVTPDVWVGERLEYQFRIAAGDVMLGVPSHLGGEIGWSTFDALPDVDLPEPPPGSPAAEAAERQVHALLASPLRYPGMPADRLWELEDAQVNLGRDRGRAVTWPGCSSPSSRSPTATTGSWCRSTCRTGR